jgi:adenine-specific DNA-methyltransferase
MSEILEPETLEPEKLDLASLDIAAEKQAELLRLFPEARTEGGKIDFDRLRLALGEAVDVGKERYGMNWPGKADCFKAIQRPSLGTLLPVREESVNFDETENLIIEGDNLEVLKLLQKSYQGKVKMIYIDPPYNTGNDFIYPDNYSESLQTYLEYTGQVDSEGRKFSNNLDSDGRFHSKWMSMMYPRLYLARNIMRDDGVIFISVDDHEVTNLKTICSEVFGEENFIITITWEKGRKNDSRFFSETAEYMHVFAKSKETLAQSGDWREKKPGLEPILSRYNALCVEHLGNHDAIEEGMRLFYAGLEASDPSKRLKYFWRSDTRGLFFGDNISSASTSIPDYEVIHPRTGKPCKKPSRGWGCNPDEMERRLSEDRVLFGEDETTIPLKKSYLVEIDSIVKTPVIYKDGRAASLTLKGLLGPGVFDNPKDHQVLAELISYASCSDAIVCDFFAGSGSTAHAILELNLTDDSNRKFILVQLPEPTEREDYKTIAEITKERVRRVIQRHEKEAEGKLDLGNRPKEGFRVLKLATSNFNVWNATTETTAPDALGQQLELHIDHIQPGRSAEDLLYEILLKSSFPPTTPIETLTIEGKTVYSVTGYGMLICLDKQLTHEAIKAMAERKPSLVVCLDEGFAGNDQLKTNAVLIMKSKGVTKFQTI